MIIDYVDTILKEPYTLVLYNDAKKTIIAEFPFVKKIIRKNKQKNRITAYLYIKEEVVLEIEEDAICSLRIMDKNNKTFYTTNSVDFKYGGTFTIMRRHQITIETNDHERED